MATNSKSSRQTREGEASTETSPIRISPRPKNTRGRKGARPEPRTRLTPVDSSTPATLTDGQHFQGTQPPHAVRNQIDDGQRLTVTPHAPALIDTIVETYRRAIDMQRAQQRLDLQAQAICRRLCDGDKGKAAKLWAVIKAGRSDDLRAEALTGIFLVAMGPLAAERAGAEKQLERLARDLPVYAWAKGVKGLGDRSLAMIVGACAAPVGEYRSPSCVWKRMGLAVIGGERQRRVAGDAAIEHGYDAQRRALMWNIGECLLKAQVRKDGEDTPEAKAPRVAIGEYGALYLERKAYELGRGRSPMHAHNCAKRYIEKRLLKHLWQAWRQAMQLTITCKDAPAAVNSPIPAAEEVVAR